MFDYIDFEMICSVCGNKINDFQSKDGPCMLETLSPFEVSNFYSSCKKCGAWIEFTKKYILPPKFEGSIPLKVILQDFDMKVKEGDKDDGTK
jgi:hypothetical protein